MHDFFSKGYRLAFMFFFTVAFISCATTTQRVSEDAMQAIKTVEIYIGHPQQPLVYQRAVKGARTGAVIAGMVGILIAEAVSMGVNTQWEGPGNKVVQSLSDFDHMALLENDLKQTFDKAGIGVTIHRSKALSDIFTRPEKIEEILEDSTADAVVVLSYDYRLRQGFDVQLLGASEVYAVSEQALRFADERKLIVNRLLDNVELVEKEQFDAKTPDQLANAIIASDAEVIREGLTNSSKKVAASVASLLGVNMPVSSVGEKYTMR